MLGEEKIFFSVNGEVDNEASTPLNKNAKASEIKTKTQWKCSFNVRILVASIVVIGVCVSTASIYYTKIRKIPDFSVKMITRTNSTNSSLILS